MLRDEILRYAQNDKRGLSTRVSGTHRAATIHLWMVGTSMYLWYNPAQVRLVQGNLRQRRKPTPSKEHSMNSKLATIHNVQQCNQTYTWRSG